MMTVTYDLDTWREGDQVFSAMAKCVGGAYVLAEDYEALQSELAERQENLNVQDNVIDGLREEIAALRKTIAEAVPTLDQFVSEVAHAQASGSSWYTRGAAGLYGHIAMWRGKAAVALAALREAGHLKEEV